MAAYQKCQHYGNWDISLKSTGNGISKQSLTIITTFHSSFHLVIHACDKQCWSMSNWHASLLLCTFSLHFPIKATTGDPSGISSTRLTMLFHIYKYQYYTITNPWVSSGVAPCACQYGSWKPLLSILGNEPFHLKHCLILTSFMAHKESGTKYHLFELLSDRLCHESNIYGMVERNFEFKILNKIK